MKIKRNGEWVDFSLPVVIPTMTGASSSTNGSEGLVPIPAAGDQDKYLKADGTWEAPAIYIHPTTSGNKHIPSGGSSGQILRWSADGTAEWGEDNNTWRGIQDNLTSNSITDSLSAAQGKILKGLVDGKADQATTLAGYNITDAYTKAEVNDKVNVRSSNTLPDDAPDGTIIINPDEDTEIFNVDNINIDIDSALSLISTNPVQNKVVTKELERIPCKLTVKSVSFDGGILTEENTSEVNYNIVDGAKYEDYGYSLLTSQPTVKTVYKNHTYRLILEDWIDDVSFGHYYDPIAKGVELSDPDIPIYNYDAATEKVFTVTQDTEITIMLQKKREPITLTINLKDKNGNFVSDNVIVTDSFNNGTSTFGTYGKTPGQFTVQVTKGYEYTITPSLKGYNKKENNSPADPDRTTITQTSTEDAVIDIVYNKIYPNDFETDWASFHAQIAANPETEVLPIGTELSTVYKDTVHNKTVLLKWNIVNWRYGEKEDGSQVWGCDLFQKGTFPDNTYIYDSAKKIWGQSDIRNILSGLSEQYQNNDFKNNLQAVKVTTGTLYEGSPDYSYDKMWIPSATELYIDTLNYGSSIDVENFTQIDEGNSNESYWKNVIGLTQKLSYNDRNGSLKEVLVTDTPSSEGYGKQSYWLRSRAFLKSVVPAEPSEDGSVVEDTIFYDYQGFMFCTDTYYGLSDGRTSNKNSIRPMCFFA